MMKKLDTMSRVRISVLITLIISLSASAQLSTRASMDYFPTGSRELIVVRNNESQDEFTASYGHFRVRIGADYRLGRFKAYFDQNVYMDFGGIYTFKPNNADWTVGMKLRIFKNIELRVEHMCSHPVMNDIWRQEQGVMVRKAYDMISIGYGY